jgi:hypothetical protein
MDIVNKLGTTVQVLYEPYDGAQLISRVWRAHVGNDAPLLQNPHLRGNEKHIDHPPLPSLVTFVVSLASSTLLR